MCLYVSHQDYSNALRVTVKGQATLKLITHKTNIRMDSQTSLVCGDDDNDDDINDNDQDNCIDSLCLYLGCSSQ